MLERRQQPMHVGGLMLFKIPADAPANFIQEVAAQFKAVTLLFVPLINA